MDTKAVRTGLGKIKGMFGGVARTAGKAFKMGGKGILAGGGIIVAAAAAVGAMTIGTAKWAKNLKTISNQTGVSVKETLALREAFQAAGVEIADDADLISDFQEKIEDAVRGGGTGQEGYDILGLSAFGLRKIRDPMRQLEVLFAAVENSQLSIQNRAFALDKIFGGQGFPLGHLASNFSKFMAQALKDTEGRANALDDQIVGELEHVLRIVDRIKIQFRMALVQYMKVLPLDKIMEVIDKVMAVTLRFLTDPGKFLKETWIWFKAEMQNLWEIMLKALTEAFKNILPKIPEWMNPTKWLIPKKEKDAPPFRLQGPSQVGGDLNTRTLASIDATMLRMERKPGATFA